MINKRSESCQGLLSHAAGWPRRHAALSVSAALLILVYWGVDARKLAATLGQIRPASIAALFLLYAASQLVSAAKWRIFLREAGIERSLWTAVKAYYLGMYVNTFGLGTVGGDITRSVAVRPGVGRAAAAIGTVAADRLHGLFTLILIGAAGLAAAGQIPGHRGTLGAGLAVGGVILGGWLLAPRLTEALSGRNHRLADTLRAALAAIPRRPGVLSWSFLLAASAHTLQVAMHMIIADQLGLEIEPAYFFAMVPVVSAASCLPVSVNGLGIREGMYLLWLAPFGATRESAVVFGAVWLVVLLLVGWTGALGAGSLMVRRADEQPAAGL